MKTRSIQLIMVTLLAVQTAWGLEDPSDAIDRTMAFVDRSAEATRLLSAGKTAEALTVFQDILSRYGDLDQDGYVAVSVGDCLMALNRPNEARFAYQAAGQSHPELADSMNQRLLELDLAGEITDDLLARLRFAVQMSTPVDFMPNWRLGRALQKRAKSVLAEATAAFRAAQDAGAFFGEGAGVSGHVAELEELTEDLGSLIDTLETRWEALRSGNLQQWQADQAKPPRIASEKPEWKWEVKVNNQSPVAVQITGDDKGHRQFLVDGKLVSLNMTQALLLKHHEQRINEILLEAAGRLDNTTGK